jgi:hypothetical protein
MENSLAFVFVVLLVGWLVFFFFFRLFQSFQSMMQAKESCSSCGASSLDFTVQSWKQHQRECGKAKVVCPTCGLEIHKRALKTHMKSSNCRLKLETINVGPFSFRVETVVPKVLIQLNTSQPNVVIYFPKVLLEPFADFLWKLATSLMWKWCEKAAGKAGRTAHIQMSGPSIAASTRIDKLLTKWDDGIRRTGTLFVEKYRDHPLLANLGLNFNCSIISLNSPNEFPFWDEMELGFERSVFYFNVGSRQILYIGSISQQYRVTQELEQGDCLLMYGYQIQEDCMYDFYRKKEAEVMSIEFRKQYTKEEMATAQQLAEML